MNEKAFRKALRRLPLAALVALAERLAAAVEESHDKTRTPGDVVACAGASLTDLAVRASSELDNRADDEFRAIVRELADTLETGSPATLHAARVRFNGWPECFRRLWLARNGDWQDATPVGDDPDTIDTTAVEYTRHMIERRSAARAARHAAKKGGRK